MFNKGFKKGIVKLFFGSLVAIICLQLSIFSTLRPPSAVLNAVLGVGMFGGYLAAFLGLLELRSKNFDYTVATVAAAAMSLAGLLSIFQTAPGRLGELAVQVSMHMRTVDILLAAFVTFAFSQDAVSANRKDLIQPLVSCSTAYIISGVLSAFLPSVAGLPLAGVIFGGTILAFSLFARFYYLRTLNQLRLGKKPTLFKSFDERREERRAKQEQKEAEKAAQEAAAAEPGVVPPRPEFKPTLADRIRADNEDALRLAAEARGEEYHPSEESADTIAEAAESAADTIAEAAESAADTAADTVENAADTAADTAENAADTVAEAAENAADTIVEAAESAADTAAEAAENIADKAAE